MTNNTVWIQLATGAPITLSVADQVALTADEVAQHAGELHQALTAQVGRIHGFAGPVPEGWLACDGAAVSRQTYAALFAAIGTSWGAGDGETTFALPRLPRKTLAVPAGAAATITVQPPAGEEGAPPLPDVPVGIATLTPAIKA